MTATSAPMAMAIAALDPPDPRTPRCRRGGGRHVPQLSMLDQTASRDGPITASMVHELDLRLNTFRGPLVQTRTADAVAFLPHRPTAEFEPIVCTYTSRVTNRDYGAPVPRSCFTPQAPEHKVPCWQPRSPWQPRAPTPPPKVKPELTEPEAEGSEGLFIGNRRPQRMSAMTANSPRVLPGDRRRGQSQIITRSPRTTQNSNFDTARMARTMRHDVHPAVRPRPSWGRSTDGGVVEFEPVPPNSDAATSPWASQLVVEDVEDVQVMLTRTPSSQAMVTGEVFWEGGRSTERPLNALSSQSIPRQPGTQTSRGSTALPTSIRQSRGGVLLPTSSSGAAPTAYESTTIPRQITPRLPSRNNAPQAPILPYGVDFTPCSPRIKPGQLPSRQSRAQWQLRLRRQGSHLL